MDRRLVLGRRALREEVEVPGIDAQKGDLRVELHDLEAELVPVEADRALDVADAEHGRQGNAPRHASFSAVADTIGGD